MGLAVLLQTLALLVAHVSAGHLAATGGNRASRRALSQLQDAEISSGHGLFYTTIPCSGLVDILTDTPDPNSLLGNFTEIPPRELLLDCVRRHSVLVYSGETLIAGLQEPTPLLKLISLDDRQPTVWPAGTVTITPLSVNVLDCQNQILDMRNRPAYQPTSKSTSIFFRCIILLPDVQNSWAWQNMFVDTATLYPCDGRTSYSEAGDYPLTQPRHVDNQTANVGSSHVHLVNYTVACFTDQEVETLLRDAEPSDGEQQGGTSGLPSWGPWAIAAGGAALACMVLATVWACCGWTCCGYRMGGCPSPHGPQSRQKDDTHGHKSTMYSSDREASDDLVSSLRSILDAYGVRGSASNSLPSKVKTTHLASATTSDSTQYHVPGYELRECPDCGQPHPGPLHHQCRSCHSGATAPGAKTDAAVKRREHAFDEGMSADDRLSCHTGSITFAPHNNSVGGGDSIGCSSIQTRMSIMHVAREKAENPSQSSPKALHKGAGSRQPQELFDAQQPLSASSPIASPRSENGSPEAAQASPEHGTDAVHVMHDARGGSSIACAPCR